MASASNLSILITLVRLAATLLSGGKGDAYALVNGE